jgi:bis(5'-nucleosyl)-tetraphosphatase (symmetrical)
MAVWAIGDIQGCYSAFRKLLDKIDFDPKVDKLWVAGDLVNRGEGSLETLEYLFSIKESVQIVLGNHDITLIAIYYGLKKSNPSLDPIFASANASRIIEWLRFQKFLHVDYQLGYCMVHAGISPKFDLGMAMRYAKRIEMKLQGDNPKAWLEDMFTHGVAKFDKKALDVDIERYAIGTFIRMRFCDEKGHLNFKQKGKPNNILYAKGLRPWFDTLKRHHIDLKIIFGHWSTLGLYHDKNVLGLDTGCLWGEKLTVARIDTKKIKIVEFKCQQTQKPTEED